MSLDAYWPRKDEIERCIKSEAENSSDEVLFAVHQNFPLQCFNIGGDGKILFESERSGTEQDLLNYFIEKAPSGSHLVPITGASGVGKSHLIRMLDARLRRLPNADDYLIIRIPKSASLRKVVQLILDAEPLKAPAYDGVRKEFDKALIDVPLGEAVKRLQSELAIALFDEARRLANDLKKDRTNVRLRDLLAHAQKLPDLFTDAVTKNYFESEIFPRILQRPVNGFVLDQAELTDIDPINSKFQIEDFNLDHLDLQTASISVRNYYNQILCSDQGQKKLTAVNVLNDVVDSATSQLYKLNESIGGMTLAEVILEIRKLLLIDKKELVILVEDYAALVGIQGTLAKVLIQEGVYNGVQQLATIRSAIAVTDGYLEGRDSISTRAGKQWLVQSRFEQERQVVLSRIKLIVGSYLNAARYGEDKLKEIYNNNPNLLDSTLTPFSGYLNDEEQVIIEAFGTHNGKEDGIYLFPYTENAIENLADKFLKVDNQIVFTPRTIIKNIIRTILLEGYDAFKNKEFPPIAIKNQEPQANINEFISLLPLSVDLKDRYKRFVVIWGNNPNNLYVLLKTIPKEVFSAFGLEPLELGNLPPPPPPPPPTIGGGDGNDFIQVIPQEIENYRNQLENWIQNDQRLPQGFANKIRSHLAKLVNQRIDWNSERCTKSEIFKSSIFSIPNAGGEGNVSVDSIKIVESNVDPDGSLRSELLSLLRFFDVYGGRATYNQVDDDIARIANLYDRISPQIFYILRDSVKKQNQSVIFALSVNSRLLGISESKSNLDGIYKFLFSDNDGIEEFPEGSSFKVWQNKKEEANIIRSQLQKLIYDTSGVFQGTQIDSTLYGIDIVRLFENLPDHEYIFDNKFMPSIKDSIQNTNESKSMNAINVCLEKINKTQKKIIENFHDELNKQVIVDSLLGLTAKFIKEGVWEENNFGISYNDYKRLCEDFRSSALKDSINKLKQIHDLETIDRDQSPNINSKKILKFAQIKLTPFVIADNFIDISNKIVKEIERYTVTLENQHHGFNPTEQANKIESTLKNIIKNLEFLQKECNNDAN